MPINVNMILISFNVDGCINEITSACIPNDVYASLNDRDFVILELILHIHLHTLWSCLLISNYYFHQYYHNNCIYAERHAPLLNVICAYKPNVINQY